MHVWMTTNMANRIEFDFNASRFNKPGGHQLPARVADERQKKLDLASACGESTIWNGSKCVAKYKGDGIDLCAQRKESVDLASACGESTSWDGSKCVAKYKGDGIDLYSKCGCFGFGNTPATESDIMSHMS